MFASEATSVQWVESFLAGPIRKNTTRLDRNEMPGWAKLRGHARAPAADQPLRLRRNDAALFAKAQKDLQANLMSIPSWALTSLEHPPETRIAVAVDWLQILGLAQRVGVPGEDLRVQATKKGEAWLGESAKGRLKAVLDHFRALQSAPRLFHG